MKSIAVALAIAVLLPGCSGLKLWEKEKYFRMHSDPTYDPNATQSVGVYVFSNGGPINAMKPQLDGFDYADGLISMPVMIMTFGTIGWSEKRTAQYDLSDNVFPPEIAADLTLAPDTSNAGPSLELARSVERQLSERGYKASVEDELGHDREITVEQVFADARAHGHDAVFIVSYSGLTQWQRVAGGSASRDMSGRWQEAIQMDVYAGYLYLPNAAMYDLRSGGKVWSNSYYGIVERASIANLASDPFIQVIPEAVVDNGEASYFESAPKAAKMLFEPVLWPGSIKPFPVRSAGSRRKM